MINAGLIFLVLLILLTFIGLIAKIKRELEEDYKNERIEQENKGWTRQRTFNKNRFEIKNYSINKKIKQYE